MRPKQSLIMQHHSAAGDLHRDEVPNYLVNMGRVRCTVPNFGLDASGVDDEDHVD
jgi:hypothetical protein